MIFTPLWTDILVWVLMFAIGAWGLGISKSPQVKKQWKNIFKSKIAIISAIVLLFYLVFTLLDSVHFKFKIQTNSTEVQNQPYKGKIVSLLDVIFSHNLTNTERTYSAPFATHEYAKSIVVNEDGITKQINLPLKYVSKGANILKESLWAIFMGVIISTILIALHIWWRRKTLNTNSDIPWKTAYATFLTLVVTFTWLYLLSFHYHVLGTDKVGGDVLYHSLKSIRTGVLIGLLTTLIMLPLSIILGVSAGFLGGWVDDVVQYIYTTLSSIPGVLLIAAGVLAMQVMMDNNPNWFESTIERSDLRMLFLIVILGITSWTGLCRLIRAETLKVSQVEFVTAAKAFGVSKFTIIRRHIIPNLMHIILISVVLDFSGLVLAEAVLSYVGVGVDPTMHSWGNMINQARLEMAREPMVWWSLFSAFIFMFVLVLAANLFSDRVQKVLDPRNKI